MTGGFVSACVALAYIAVLFNYRLTVCAEDKPDKVARNPRSVTLGGNVEGTKNLIFAALYVIGGSFSAVNRLYGDN